MTWWSWMILGTVILCAELFAIDAQFYLVFIGLSAALVGLGQLVGIAMPEWAQWTTFAVLSLVSMFTFRKNLYLRIHGDTPGFPATPEGETLIVDVSIEPDGENRTEFRGSEWTVRNVGRSPIESGTRARIIKIDGLTLHVSADPDQHGQ